VDLALLAVAVLRLLRPLPEAISGLLLLVLGLALAFGGRALVKALIFVASGLVGAAVALALFGPLVSSLLLVPLWIGGFLAGGILALLFLPLGLGLALGYLAFSLALSAGLGLIISAVAGLLLFLAGLLASEQVLGLLTAALGGLLTLSALLLLSSPLWLAALLAVLVAAGGLLVQLR
jgi:hypothetical protein